MESFTVFPNAAIEGEGTVSRAFDALGVSTFHDACRYVHHLPYGYNSDRDDLLILFKEKMGSCTTKHAVIATLAEELGLPVRKEIGIYAMTEAVVTGTDRILEAHKLPYLPMVHCYLTFDRHRVDLTEGNRNGKNTAIGTFLHTEAVIANISAKDEYLLYRRALKDRILLREELGGVDIKTVLRAREQGLALLRKRIEPERRQSA